MRAALLVLTACAPAASSPAQPHSEPPSALPPHAAPTMSRSTHARIAIDPDGWIEITVEGSDATARAACEELVDAELAIRPGARARLRRPCEAVPLPALHSSAPFLVTSEPIDDNTLAVDDLIRGKRSERRAPVHGIIVVYEPFADADECERSRVQLTTDEQREWFVIEQGRISDIDHNLASAVAEETDACARHKAASDRCTTLRGDAYTQCQLEAEPPRITCGEMQRRRAQLEHERAVRPHQPSRTRRCQLGS